MRFDFSVIIPYYNVPATMLELALSSVASAKGNRARGDSAIVELILVDDGSDPKLAKQAAETINNTSGQHGLTLRQVTHPANLGLAAARNSGISRATGKYVVFLDADDWLLPESLSALKEHLQVHPAQITYTLTAKVNDPSQFKARPAGTDLAISAAFEKTGSTSARPQELAELALALSSWSQVYDREFLDRERLGFDPALRHWEDRPFVVRTHLAARSIKIYPHLFRAYFTGTKGHGTASITRRKFEIADLGMMYRHLRLVHKSLSRAKEVAGSPYAAQHFWLSVQRYFSVMGGAARPVFFSNSKARRLCLGTGRWLWQQQPLSGAARQNLAAPLPGTPLAKIPSMLRSLLVWTLQHANSGAGALALYGIFTMTFVFRRLRVLFR